MKPAKAPRANRKPSAGSMDETGVEFRHTTRDQWAFVVADASHEGRQRVQLFDRHGFFAHSTHATVRQAMQAMWDDGHVIRDEGALERLSSTAAWHKGLEIARLGHLLKMKKLSIEQFHIERALLTERYGCAEV